MLLKKKSSTLLTLAVNMMKMVNIIEEKVEVRIKQTQVSLKNEVDYIDVATNQAFSVATSMIPFLEHDDATVHSWEVTCKSKLCHVSFLKHHSWQQVWKN
jgi:DNA-directed RNA polymerase beta subunit